MRWMMATLAVAVTAWTASAGLVDTVVDSTAGGPTLDGVINPGEYSGTVSGGGAGFGGPVGGATLHLDADANGIYLGFENLGDISNNTMMIWIDSVAGGLGDTSGLNDFADFGRGRVSSFDGPLTLPFAADFGWVVTPAFGGFQALFQLAEGGDNSLIFAGNNGTTGTPVGENPSNAVIELFAAYADLGIAQGDIVDFAVTYANNNTPAFVSNEGFPGPLGADNLGEGAATLTDFHRLNTIPEPASLALIGLGGLALLRRR